jgi:predicted CopG family antitoxin
MPKTVTIRIKDDTYRSFVKRAKTENRSLANFIETAVKERIRERDFVDDFEMAELLANEELVRRLRKGSGDAKRKKGTMIG